MWDLIVSVPDHCLSVIHLAEWEIGKMRNINKYFYENKHFSGFQLKEAV